MKALISSTDSHAVCLRVLRAAAVRLGLNGNRAQADFEHGQWWLTDKPTGRQWSVVDCETADGVTYLDFEQVSQGEDE